MASPESPAFDEHQDARVPEPHGESAEATETSPTDLNDTLPRPDLPSDGRISADDMNGEAPD